MNKKIKIRNNKTYICKNIYVGVTMKVIDKISLVLMVIGSINWGLIGIFKFDLVATLFGDMTVLSRIVYTLVGISGIWGIKMLFDKD